MLSKSNDKYQNMDLSKVVSSLDNKKINRSNSTNNIALPNDNVINLEAISYLYGRRLKSDNTKQYDAYIPHEVFDIIKKEIAVSMEGDNMNDDKYLEMYISKIDEDRRDLQSEFKEREQRIERQLEKSEQRINDKFDKIEKLILDQNRSIEKLEEEVRNKIADDRKYRHTNNIAIIIGVITTVLTILGIALATQSNITDIISLTFQK